MRAEFDDRMTRIERDARVIREEWEDALAKMAKIGARLAAQARRDIAKAADELSSDPAQMDALGAPAARPLSREEQRAQLRRNLRAAQQQREAGA